MKKIFAIFTVLALLAGGLFAGQVGSGTLTVYGKIGAGDISFDVVQEQDSEDKVDLLNDSLIDVDGDGYKIGYWRFIANNQSAAVEYTLAYAYSALSTNNDGITHAIGIELLEYADEDTYAVKETGDTTTLSASSGNNDIKRDIHFRLNATGADVVDSRPASENYKTTVTITLTTD